MTLEENIEVRKKAKSMLEFILEDAGESRVKYLRTLMQEIEKELPLDVDFAQENYYDRMMEKEAQEFEKKIMPFGLHEGKPIRELPLGYLLWLADQGNFHRNIARYVRSVKVQLRIEEE